MLDYVYFIVVKQKVNIVRMTAFLIPRNPVLRLNFTNPGINLFCMKDKHLLRIIKRLRFAVLEPYLAKRRHYLNIVGTSFT